MELDNQTIRENLIWLMRAGTKEQNKYYLNFKGGAQRLAAAIYEYVLPTIGGGW